MQQQSGSMHASILVRFSPGSHLIILFPQPLRFPILKVEILLRKPSGDIFEKVVFSLTPRKS
jgi:hypothetical protein